jgi:hypothetical protein
MLGDAEFNAEAERLRLPLAPRSGEEMARLVEGMFVHFAGRNGEDQGNGEVGMGGIEVQSAIWPDSGNAAPGAVPPPESVDALRHPSCQQYTFTTIDRLLADFRRDISKWRREHEDRDI